MANFLQSLQNFLSGTPETVKQLQRFTPQQQSLFELLQNLGMQGLQNPNQLDPISQQAQKNFQQNIIPSLSERFTGSTGGAQSSPAFASQLGQAGAGLAGDLAASQRSQLMSLLSLGLTPQYDNYIQEGQPGFLSQLAPALGRAGMAWATGGGSELMSLLGMLGSGAASALPSKGYKPDFSYNFKV